MKTMRLYAVQLYDKSLFTPIVCGVLQGCIIGYIVLQMIFA